MTEKEIVISSTSLKQSSNRCSREWRNPATLNWSTVHQARAISCLKSPEEKSSMGQGANGLQVGREEPHNHNHMTTHNHSYKCWQLACMSLVWYRVSWLSYPLILGFYLPCVWFHAHTLSLALWEQPSRIRNSTTSSCPYSAARWNAVLSIFERKQKYSLRKAQKAQD